MASINLCLLHKKCTILYQNLRYFNHQTDEAEWLANVRKKIVKYKRFLIEISQENVKKQLQLKVFDAQTLS